MKKVVFAAVVLGGLAFTACKKDHTCSCTFTSGGISITADTVYTDMKKSDAETQCNSMDASGSIGSESFTQECELK